MSLDLTHKEQKKDVKIYNRIYRGENNIRWKRKTDHEDNKGRIITEDV